MAYRTLERLEHLRNGPPIRDSAVLSEPFSLEMLEAVYNKPESRKTTQKARMVLLAVMTKVTRPRDEQISWLVKIELVSVRISRSRR